MALLDMSANKQCNGYFPGYHSPRNLVFAAKGSAWTSSNGNSECENDCYRLSSLSLSSTCHLSGYSKELLKQTILKHEAIFKDQINELHRIYQKQRELMDEIKRIELHKHSLRLETSLSSSSLYYSQKLPWLTSQSSVFTADGIQLPLASMQEKSWPLCPTLLPDPAPTTTRESLKDPKLSGLAYRKVGKKLLDLQLPADEYIDSEGESCENERVMKETPLSTYTLDGISKVANTTIEKPYEANANGFANLNLPFKVGETGVNSDDFGGPIPLRYHTFNEMPGRRTPASHNLPNDVIQNLERKQDHEACPDPLLPNRWENHGLLLSGTSAGQNGDDLESLAKFNDREDQSVSIDSISKKLKQVNNYPFFRSIHQIVPGSRTEIPAGTHHPASGSWLGPSYASCTSAPHKLISESGMKSSGISPSVLWKSTTPGPNLYCQNYLLNRQFCSRSNRLDLPPISIDDLNSCDNTGSSPVGHAPRKYVKDSEYVRRTHKSINLNVMPAGCSDTTAAAFQSIQIGEDKFQDSRFPWLKAKPVPKGKPNEESQTSTHVNSFILNSHKSGCVHFDLMDDISDLCTDRTLAFDLNGNPQTSKVFQSLSRNHWIEEIKKISNVNSTHDREPDMGEQVSASERFTKNEKHKHLAGILDLNSYMNEDENMPINIDLQAPASPENKECSPPRGESDENQLEIPLQLAGEQEDLEAREEKARIAAKALVSISEAVAYNGLPSTTCPSSESSVSSSLQWFAGIVSTIVDHSECEVRENFNCTIKDLEDFLPADFDYFEFMSLHLSETKDLDYCCCKSSDQNEVFTSPTQPRKCRTNRRRHGNDFQSEILPSLASLSRYEVTEDLQTIGGLVEAARRSHSTTGCPKSAGRNVLAKGKRKSCASASNITDLLLDLNQLNINTEIAIEKMGFISWGKICRKPRGKRLPSSKPHFIFSQVHN